MITFYCYRKWTYPDYEKEYKIRALEGTHKNIGSRSLGFVSLIENLLLMEGPFTKRKNIERNLSGQ